MAEIRQDGGDWQGLNCFPTPKNPTRARNDPGKFWVRCSSEFVSLVYSSTGRSPTTSMSLLTDCSEGLGLMSLRYRNSRKTSLRTVIWTPIDSIEFSGNSLVRSRRLELPRELPHSDLNAARLPIPPRPHCPDLVERSLAAPAKLVKSKGTGASQKNAHILAQPSSPRNRRHRLAAMYIRPNADYLA